MTTDLGNLAADTGPANDTNGLQWWQHQTAWLADRSRFRIALKARQVGWSTVLAAEALAAAVEGQTTLCCAAGERQARELLRKARLLLPLVRASAGEALEVVRESADGIELSSGGRIIAVPASAATVQGFSGNLILDEFAWCADQDSIWSALVPTITANEKYRLSVVSTPRARGDKFHKLWTEADTSVWSKHKVTIDEAVQAGCPHDTTVLKAAVADEVVWRGMYLCEFVDEQYSLLPYDLLQSCVDDSLPYKAAIPKLAGRGDLFIGVDIGRVRDLTVIVALELLPDRVVFRGAFELAGAPFDEQESLLDRVMSLPNVRRCTVDASGLGLMLSERLRRKHGWRVTPLTITYQSKEDMCVRLQRAFQRGEIAIPSDATLLADLHAVEKSITSSGNLRYSAARGKHGHSDRFMALGLALVGCDRLIGRPPLPPPKVIVNPGTRQPSRSERATIETRERMAVLSYSFWSFK